MKFTKMHGCGNDYVYVNGFLEQISQEEKPELVRRLSDRHFGIGGDGVIFINPSPEADFEMEMYNADGTRAQMCGNGIRCVAKFVYDKGLTDKEEISVISAGSIKRLSLTLEGKNAETGTRGTVKSVRVDMGSPVLKAAEIPVISDNDTVVDELIYVDDREYRMTCVSMGNPHAVVYMNGVADMNLESIGPSFENHVRFPERVNTEFVEVLDRQTVFMRVWERGTGETLACGTGCCATAVACVLNGLTENRITVKLLGGELQIEWNREENTVYMTGPAETVFEGEVDI
ncbi:MAG: diaminopimelate epimerase [Acetatifactor sp.]